MTTKPKTQGLIKKEGNNMIDSKDKKIFERRILRFLSDAYNQNMQSATFENNLASNIDTTLSNIEDILTKFDEDKLISRFNDLSGNPMCRIMIKGLEYLENNPTPLNTQKIDEKPLEFDVSHEDHTGKIKVFISHKFVESDQKLAETLQKFLNEHNIYGQMAERTREYDLGWDEKIKRDINSSDYLVAILTKNSLYAPSVHQEIGYAIGVKVPVRILVEEEEVKGVLVQGKDSEKFSRPDFEKHLDNIIKDILKRGIRKKLTDKEKEELIQNVYDPCYNQMMNVYKIRDFITEIPPNPWESISHAWQRRTEPDIIPLFEEYTKELEKWREMWVDFGNKCQTNRRKIGEMLEPIFKNFFMLNENGHITFGGGTISLEGWVQNCKEVIFNPAIQNRLELYKILKEHAFKKWGKNYSKYFDKWHKEDPQIYSELLKVIPNMIEMLDAEFTYDEIDQQRNILKEKIEILTNTLEGKLR